MPDIFTLETKIKQMIDELKGLCQTNGLSNQASEEVVITSVFLYKFLNDKFMANLKEFADETGLGSEEILRNEEDELSAFYDSYPQDVAFRYEDTIECLINEVGNDDFYTLLIMRSNGFLIIRRTKSSVLIQQMAEESHCLQELQKM